MSKEKYLEELSDELRIAKPVLKKFIYAVGTNKENIKDYAKNGFCAIVRKDNGFDVSYVAQMLNEKDAKIKDLEHRLSNCIEPKFKLNQEVYAFFTKEEIYKGQIDAFDYYTNTYLIFPNEDIGNEWIPASMVFATLKEAKSRLEEIQNANN